MREPGAAAEAQRRKVQGGLCDARVEGQSEWGEGRQHPKRRRCVGTRQQMWSSTREAVKTGLVSSKGGTVISQKPILLQCARWRGEESTAEGTASRPSSECSLQLCECPPRILAAPLTGLLKSVCPRCRPQSPELFTLTLAAGDPPGQGPLT